MELNIREKTTSIKSILTTSNPIRFIPKLNELLQFANTHYTKETHKSGTPVMITTTDKVHLNCDCVDGSIVNGIEEQILFSFNLHPPPGYKTIEEPNTILYKKKQNTTG